MPLRSNDNSLKTMYKSKQEREGQASIASRRKSVRMERKQQREKEIDKRRMLTEMSPVVDYLEDTLNNETIQSSPKTRSRTSKFRSSAKTQANPKDPHVLSLRERLQVWREEKQKQQEMKKKHQPPAFIVKNIEHTSDFTLYREDPKNKKKLPKLEMNLNFAKAEKPAQHNRKDVAGPKQTTAFIKKDESQQKSNNVKSKAMAATKSLRVTRQTVKSDKQSGNTDDTARVLARGAKSPSGLRSAAQMNKPKSKLVRGDLHSRLTASAAAKMHETTGKPKDFLRSKSHGITRTSQAQAKQEKAGGGLRSSHAAKTTLKHSISHMSMSNQSQMTQRSVLSSATSDTDSEIRSGVGLESPAKRPRRSAAKTALDEDMMAEDQSTEISSTEDNLQGKETIKKDTQQRNSIAMTAAPSGGEMSQSDDYNSSIHDMEDNRSVRKTRQSVFNHTTEREDNFDLDGRLEMVSSMRMDFSNQEQMCVNSSNKVDAVNIVNIKSTPGRKSRRSSALTSLTEGIIEKAEIPDRKFRHFVGINTSDNKEEQTNADHHVNEPERNPEEASINEELLKHSRLRNTLAKDLQQGILPEANCLTTQNLVTENLVLRRSSRKSTAQGTTWISSEDEQFSVYGQKKFTPHRKLSRPNVGTPASVGKASTGSVATAVGQCESETSNTSSLIIPFPNGSGQDSISHKNDQSKVTAKKRSRRSVVGDKNEKENKANTPSVKSLTPLDLAGAPSVDEQEAAEQPVRAKPNKHSRRSVKGLPAEEQSDSRSSSVNTPGRRTCRSVISISVKEQLNPTMTPLQSRKTAVKEPTKFDEEEPMKATPNKHSRYSVRKLPAEELSDSSSSPVNTPGKKSHVPDSVKEQLKPSATPLQDGKTAVKEPAKFDEEEQREVKHFHNGKEQSDLVEDDVETQASLGTGNASQLSKQQSEMSPEVGYNLRRSSGYNLGGSHRKSGRKILKSARRQSRIRAKSLARPINSSSPRPKRSRGSSTVVSVSEEGTSNWKGANVFDEVVTPNSSFAENKVPGSDTRANRRSLRRSVITGHAGSGDETVPKNSAYRLAKPISQEKTSIPLQELAVEKVEGETSYIE
ncbi:hypothetical protein PoB_004609700, partial [Plakobranchus ocellatus]